MGAPTAKYSLQSETNAPTSESAVAASAALVALSWSAFRALRSAAAILSGWPAACK